MSASAVLMGTGQGRIRVGAATAERIRAVAKELGYQPNPAARQLAGGRSGVVAIVAHNWKNFLAQRVLVWLHEAAEQQGFRVQATRLTHGLSSLEQLTRELKSGWIDGLVYLAHENQHQWDEVSELLQQVRPVVTVFGEMRVPGTSSVISDVAVGAEQTIEFLTGRGRRKPVFVTEQIETKDIQIRLAAYRQSSQERNLVFDDSQVVVETRGWNVSDPAHQTRFDGLAQRLVSQLQADSVICDTDFTAAGLLSAFRRLNVRVPDDIAVIGWGDLQFAGVIDPALTTVSHRLIPLMDLVIQELSKPLTISPEDYRIATELVIRATA